MKSMIKGLMGIFLVVLLLALTACNDKGSPDSSLGNGGAATGDEIQSITIKVTHEVAEQTSQHKGNLAFKEYIEKESDGKIKVEVYPNGQLFGDKDVYQNLVANNVQFTQIDMSKLVGDDPRFNLVSLPFLFEDNDAAVKFWNTEKGKEILGALEKDGVSGLGMWPNGPKHFTNDKHPLKTPEDFKGLKFRTQGGQVLEDLFKTLGASSVSIPFTELYTALQQGTIDGQTNTFVNIDSKKFDEVQKYLTIVGETRVDLGFFGNTEFLDGLNEATRKIIDDGILAGNEEAHKAANEMAHEALDNLKERGNIEVYELSEEEVNVLIKKWEPIYEKYASIIGEEYIEAARNINE